MGSKDKPIDPAALARARSDLGAARGKRRLDLILDQEDPAALVRALPADEVYFTVREIGLADAAELVRLAAPAQFRAFLDLDCWRGDHVDARRALPWLRAARSGAMDSPRAAARWRAKLAQLDAELLHIVLRDALCVHELEQDPDPHLESSRFMRTPEGKFVIEFLVDGAEYAAVRGVVDDLYAEDPFRASRLLSAIRWELTSELEETALRWRAGRLADLGYPTREEALSWFARPAPGAAARAGLPARPPGFYLERLGAGSFLARAADRLSPGQRDRLQLELVTAANAALVADAVDPGDLEAVQRAVQAARALVELGLEELAGSDEARGAEILAARPVRSLFQQGFARVLALKWQAERLLATGLAGGRGSPLLDPPLGELVDALARRRPLYFPGVEAPREEWGSPSTGASEPRAFLSGAELARAAEALALAEGLAALAGRLRLAPARGEGPLAPRLSALYLTALANERMGGAFSPSPLAPAELPPAARALEALADSRLDAEGGPGRLLAGMARARAEELSAVRAGQVPPAGVSALLVKG